MSFRSLVGRLLEGRSAADLRRAWESLSLVAWVAMMRFRQWISGTFESRFIIRWKLIHWKPGDGFIIESKSPLTAEQTARLREVWSRVYSNCSVIVLDSGLELVAVTRKEASPIAAAADVEEPKLEGEPFLSRDDWDACQRLFRPEDCVGLPVTAAIARGDAGATLSIVLLFDLGDGRLRLVPLFGVADRFERVEIFKRFGVKRFAYDPWQCEALARRLQEDTKAERVAVPITRLGLSRSLREFRWRVEEQKLEHNGGELTLQAERLRVDVDVAGNMRPVCKWPAEMEYRGRFDGILASIMALALHLAKGSEDAQQSEVDRPTAAEAATDVGGDETDGSQAGL